MRWRAHAQSLRSERTHQRWTTYTYCNGSRRSPQGCGGPRAPETRAAETHVPPVRGSGMRAMESSAQAADEPAGRPALRPRGTLSAGRSRPPAAERPAPARTHLTCDRRPTRRRRLDDCQDRQRNHRVTPREGARIDRAPQERSLRRLRVRTRAAAPARPSRVTPPGAPVRPTVTEPDGRASSSDGQEQRRRLKSLLAELDTGERNKLTKRAAKLRKAALKTRRPDGRRLELRGLPARAGRRGAGRGQVTMESARTAGPRRRRRPGDRRSPSAS